MIIAPYILSPMRLYKSSGAFVGHEKKEMC